MKEIKIKDLKYEDFIDEDMVLAFIVTVDSVFRPNKKSPFFAVDDDSTSLKVFTRDLSATYSSDSKTIYCFTSMEEMKNFVNSLVDTDNVYVVSYYEKEKFKDKESFEQFKTYNKEANRFFSLHTYYAAEVDYKDLYFFIVENYLLEDFITINKNFIDLITIYKSGDIEAYISSIKFEYNLTCAIKDFENFTTKIKNVFINEKKVDIINYLKTHFEEIDLDEFNENYNMALQIVNELNIPIF